MDLTRHAHSSISPACELHVKCECAVYCLWSYTVHYTYFFILIIMPALAFFLVGGGGGGGGGSIFMECSVHASNWSRTL